MNLNNLRKLNKHVKIRGITNVTFRKYGMIVTGCDFEDMIKYMEERTPIPEEGCVHVSSIKSMGKYECTRHIQDNYFGEIPIQIGYCNGINSKLNCLTYHKSNTILLAVTDMVIFVGRVQDIYDSQYEVSKAEAYFVPEGVAIELYSCTLYSLPCRIEPSGFKCLKIGLKGTGAAAKNVDISDGPIKKNEWILAHPSYSIDMDGIKLNNLLGENVEIVFSS